MKAIIVTTQEVEIPPRKGDPDELTAAIRENLDPGNLFWEGCVDHGILAAPPEDPEISVTLGVLTQLLGVPLDKIRAITLDGRSWIEVFGPSMARRTLPSGVAAVSFRVAQPPGGGKKHGLEQGATVITTISRVVGVATG